MTRRSIDASRLVSGIWNDTVATRMHLMDPPRSSDERETGGDDLETSGRGMASCRN